MTPVTSDEPVGFAIEWTAYGSVGPSHYTVAALDDVVPAALRLAIETRTAERPSIPADHDWPSEAAWTRVRYTADAGNRDRAGAWADIMRALVGAYNVSVEPVVHSEWRVLGSVAFGRVAQAVSPSAPGLTDNDLQALLDAADDRIGLDPDGRRREYRVERLLDGRRIVIDGGLVAYVLEDGVRLWLRPDADPYQRVTFDGITNGRLLLKTADGWRPISETLP